MSGRNVALTSVAGKLRAEGLDGEQIYTRLLDHPERNGLPEAECRTIARSIARKPAGEQNGHDHGNALEEFAEVRWLSVNALKRLGAVAKGEEIHFPMRDAAGNPTGYRRRRADNEPIEISGEHKKAVTKAGGKHGLICEWPLPAGPVLLTEGEIDAAAAMTANIELAVIGTPGATPGEHVIKYLAEVLAGRDVALAPDGDEAGEKWTADLTAALSKAGCAIKIIAPEERDLDKRLRAAEVPADALREMMTNAEPWPTRPKLPKVYTITDLVRANIAKPEFHIDGILPVRGSAALVAPAKLGKSRQGIQLGIAMAHGGGIEFCGMRFNRPARVMYLRAEVSDSFLQSWFDDLLADPPEWLDREKLDRFLCPSLDEFRPTLDDPARLRVIDALLTEYKPEALILDSFSFLFPAMEENKGESMGPALDTITDFMHRHKLAVVLIHHANKAGGFRGHTKFEAWPDTLLEMNAAKNDPEAIAVDGRYRHSIAGRRWWRKPDIGRPWFEEMDEPEGEDSGKSRRKPGRPAKDDNMAVIVAVLREAMRQEHKPSLRHNEIVKIIMRERDLTERTAERRVGQMVKAGWLLNAAGFYTITTPEGEGDE